MPDREYAGPKVNDLVRHKDVDRAVSATRVTEDGESQVSFDGGLSYVPVSALDPNGAEVLRDTPAADEAPEPKAD